MNFWCNIINSELLIGFIGIIAGGFITYGTIKYESKKERADTARMLLNDLKSIQRYFERMEQLKEKGVKYPPTNIGYSEDWRNLVAKCIFLENSEVEFIFEIYNRVYGYNQEREYGYNKPYNTIVRNRVLERYQNLHKDVKGRKMLDLLNRLKKKSKYKSKDESKECL